MISFDDHGLNNGDKDSEEEKDIMNDTNDANNLSNEQFNNQLEYLKLAVKV